MVLRITGKELLQNLLSLRFTLSALLIVALFGTGAFVFVGRYEQELKDYRKETDKNASALREHSSHLYKLAHYRQAIMREPKVLALCSEGFEKSLPNRFVTNAFSMRRPTVKSRGNPVLPLLRDVDWVFIVSTMLSFVAMILTYDALSGEREAGTMRLVLSGPVTRAKVLAGKYIGAMLTLGIPLVLGLVVNLIIVRSYGVAVIRPAEWPKIVAIVLVSFAYVSIFVLLGLLVSGTMRHSASSMVVLLLLWVVLVILIPSSGRLVARALRNVSTQAAMERRSAAAIQEVVDNVLAGKYGKNAGNFTSDRESPIVNPPARARFRGAMTEVGNRMLEDHIAQLIAQARAGRQFVRLSPVVLYQCTAEAMAGTGIDRWRNLYQQIKDYQGELREYVRVKDLEDPRSLHLLFEAEHEAAAWNTISRKPADFEGVPKFQERRMTLGESLKSSIWDVGLLVALNVVLFTAAHVSFTRYDVR